MCLITGLVSSTGSAQTSEYYMMSGDQGMFTVVQNGQIVRQWAIVPGTDKYQYPIVVLDTVRAMAADEGQEGAEYDLVGNDMGTRYLHEAGPTKCWDGATDGLFNYSIDTSGYIWQFELDWTNPVQLFRVNGLGSLTFDAENDSLWVSQFSSQTRIIEYSKDGVELRSFDTGHTQCMALALDPADDTFWIHDRTSQGTIENWSKDGVLLDRIAVPGLESQNCLGGEFQFGGTTPPTLEAVGDCPGRMVLTAKGMTANGKVAFVYAYAEGSVIVPSGPCAGTQLGLNRTAALGSVEFADGNGVAELITNVPGAACGKVVVQALDLTVCVTTNVVAI
ncbi:MAG: hypothetical protein D8M59_17020 [Planctomycetes bacterium]|nr:hypothetical protein [Planctomycetota bacterium]